MGNAAVTTRSIRGARIVRFGDFELDMRAAELRQNQQRVRLQEQPYRILTMLLERPGDVVLREEICKRLWPNGTVVEVSHGINAAVLRLRDALGDTAGNPRFVETVARRGYRFLAPVDVEWRRTPSARRETAEGNPSTGELPLGREISHFRLEQKLGRGGMGVVYRAEDLSLGRPVALKFLAPELAGDPQAVGRFQREARTASALNHPNVCTVYSVEECAGQPVIVMELLEGRTLESRLAEGALPGDEALPLAIQMAAALEAAHRKGIVHRDLKPGNVMVTQFGLKVLDFGLAKQSVAGAARLPAGVTEAGSIVGTPTYMAPELFQGKEADTRSDIYSLGLVLFEMLTGVRPEADPSRKLPRAASDLEPAVRRALQKNPLDRWQTAGDLRAALECIVAARISHPPAPIAAEAPAPPVPRKLRTLAGAWTGWGSGIAAAVLVLALLSYWFTVQGPRYERDLQPRNTAAIPTTTDTTVRAETKAAGMAKVPAPPPNKTLAPIAFPLPTTRPPLAGRLSLSPDGKLLAYGHAGEIYIRTVDGRDTQVAASDSGMAGTPFWSPDGSALAYTNGGKLFTLSLRGGSKSKPIGEINTALAGAWGPDGTILIGEIRGGILAIPSAGGPPRQVTRPDESRDETRHLLPQFLPGGRRFLFTAGTDKGGGTLYAGSLDSAETTPIMPINSGATFVARSGSKGILIFDRGQYLMAQKFDSATLRTEGPAIPLAGPVSSTSAAAANGISIADASITPSTLIYKSVNSRSKFSLVALSGNPRAAGEPDFVVMQNWMSALK